ncbi:MAG: hypothetical protein IJH86_03015 [Clostridia bacterium]|nr:hypothetical protein [Clostridia bacterium]
MRNKRTIQVIALVLAILLVGGTVIGALFAALAEENPPERNSYAISMEYLEDEQALHIGQRLVYVNRSPDRLDRVLFCSTPNMFRRESKLMYENDDLEAVFPAGYAPGGIDLRAVRVDGAAAEYGFQGEDELYLRVACDLAPGRSAAFEFDYYLLLTACNAFIGAGDTDARLGAFYFIPGVYDPATGDFMLKKPLPFTRWLYAEAGDYEVDLKLPEGYDAALSATEDVRELALCFGRRYRKTERRTASGVKVVVHSRRRDAGRAADRAVRAIEQCEGWFGPFPYPEMNIAESDYPLGALNYPGLMLIKDIADEAALRFCVAQQYFGMAAYVEPSADAWLSDAVSNYVAYLMLEDADGHDAFVRAINRDWVGALQLTIPGGLRVTSDAALFTAKTYDIVVKTRGAVVLHELRQAMGLEEMLSGLRAFYELGCDGRTLTEGDFVDCMDAATGGSWRDFLNDWAFNVGDYVNQPIDWLQ